ncbi:MAG TPA: 50S ribosomal protein L29 [Candidatus Paceibacterota bacterium]
MAKTKKDHLKDMKEGELVKKLTALREEVRLINFKAEGSRSKNVKELGSLKKQIARVLTQMKSK